jgi:hypothetical protein
VTEFKILWNIIDYMEANGATYKTVTFSIDQELTDEINKKHSANHSLEDIRKAADRCLAHEWIERMALNHGYTHLRITPKGIGAGRSKAKADQAKASRSRLKRASDYIEDHKGLFVVLGFIVALATFASKFFGVK